MKIAAIAYSSDGCKVLLRLKEIFGDDIDVCCKTSSDTHGIEDVGMNVTLWTEQVFKNYDALISVGAIGIVVRHISHFVKNKCVDPAVIAIDDLGRYVIPILSGHIGGANELAKRISSELGSTAIITTSTDIHNRFAVDVFAKKNHLFITSMSKAKDVSARLIDGRFVGFSSDFPIEGDIPSELTPSDGGEFGIKVTESIDDRPFDETLVLIPKDIIIGVGCKRDTNPKVMESFVKDVLRRENISEHRIKRVASIDIKKDEDAIIELSERYGADLSFYNDVELNSIDGTFSSSEFVKRITDVDCICERSAVCGGGELIMRKYASDGMTIALAKEPVVLRLM